MERTIMITLFIFTIGIVIGSFLNVCIYRIPNEQSTIFPPSHCPCCNERLKPLDLIPIFSYIFLRGVCRYCGSGFSPRYALVEFLTGIVYVVIFKKYGLGVEFIAFTYLMTLLIIVFFIDYDHMIIPDVVVLTGLVGGVILIIYQYIHPISFYENPLSLIIGAFTGSGFLIFVSIVGMVAYKSDEVMGMGDVKIFFPIGIFLGWKMTLIALSIAVLTASISSIILIGLKYKNRKSMIPFGPFIVIGTFITILWGQELFDLWYQFTFGNY
jgi:leader peptidase (prepilin peptidase)/N-methyltransferase